MPPSTKQFLIWIDLKATGPDISDSYTILSITWCITSGLDVLDDYSRSYTINHNDDVYRESSNWCKRKYNDLLGISRNSHHTLSSADEELSSILGELCAGNDTTAIHLAGENIWWDRRFMDVHLPNSGKLLHRHMLDITTFKLLVQLGVLNIPQNNVSTKCVISPIAELNHFLNYINSLN